MPVRLAFERDAQSFLSSVRLDDHRARLAAFNNLEDQFCGEAVRCGLLGDRSMLAALRVLYSEGLVHAASPERRCEIYMALRAFLQARRDISTDALLPFVLYEPWRTVVASAVIDLVNLTPVQASDVMRVPMAIREVVARGEATNRGAVFGGLLYFGDPRVCALLDPICESLDEAALREAMACATTILRAPSVEYKLAWLGRAIAARDATTVGAVAAGLVHQIRVSRGDKVLMGERPIPAWGSPATGGRPQEVMLARYRDSIAPRLRALMRAETPSVVMPRVLEAWGVSAHG